MSTIRRVDMCVQSLLEPTTLTELSQQLDMECTELTSLLQQLLKEGAVVCNTINKDTTLYWKPTKPLDNNITPQNISLTTKQPGANFQTPRANFQTPRAARMLRTDSPRLRLPFKSPSSSLFKHTVTTSNETLKSELAEIAKEISELKESYNVEELDDQIDALHKYNEVKDTGQALLGQLAVVEGVTTAQLYSRYKLNLDS